MNSKSCYLYLMNSNEKESWFLLLQRLSNRTDQRIRDSFTNPEIQPFMESLNTHVRSPFFDEKTRWFNALTGRIFLNVYHSQGLRDSIIEKLNRKIDLANMPSFINKVKVNQLDIGRSVPMISNPDLLSIERDGTICFALDIRYFGTARISISCEVTITLTKTKTFVIPIRLLIVFRRITARAFFKMNPPPTNRLWMGLYEPPTLDLFITPQVVQVPVQMSIVTAVIEKKIQEAIMENFVLPNMTDFVVSDYCFDPELAPVELPNAELEKDSESEGG